jgi:hypothetical protein
MSEKWYSISKNLPNDGEEVLICLFGQFNVAIFDEFKKGFKLKGGAFFGLNNGALKWLRIPSCSKNP